MNPKLSAGRDRGGNPFSIANAVKPSKAPITLHGMPNVRLSADEAEALVAANRNYVAMVASLQEQLARQGQRLVSLERKLGSILSGSAAGVAA